jgi:transcriptional regulator with XRE-family HTH domain
MTMKTGTTKIKLTEDQIKRNFGRFISTHRKLLEMTQQQLADKAGMDNTYLSRLEKGLIAKPRTETLEKIAKAINIDVELLIKKVFPAKDKNGLIEDSTVVFDPDNKYLPPYFVELLKNQSKEEDIVDDKSEDKETDELITKVIINLFKKELKEGDLVKNCRTLLEKKLKKELLAKAAK